MGELLNKTQTNFKLFGSQSPALKSDTGLRNPTPVGLKDKLAATQVV